MFRIGRAVVLVVVLGLVCPVPAAARQPRLWADVPLAGGVAAARTVFGLGPSEGRFEAGFAVDFVRHYGGTGEWSRITDRLRRYVSTLESIESLSRLSPGGIRLPPPNAPRDAVDAFRLVAEASGLTLRRESSGFAVSVGTSAASRERAGWLALLGFDADDIARRWNAGELVSFSLSVEQLPLPMPGVWVRSDAGAAVSLADVLRDRQSGLLYAGLMALDDETLAWLDAHRDVVRHVRAEASSAFAAFAGGLRVRDGAIDVPGGRESWNAWQAVAGASPDHPAEFLIRLLTADAGRLALFYEALAHATPATEAAILQRGVVAPESFGVVYRAFRDAATGWSLEARPFDRPVADPSWALELVDMKGATIDGPAWLPFVLERVVGEGGWPKRPATLPATLPTGDAEWLARWLFARVPGMVDRARLLRFARRLPNLERASAPDVESALRTFQDLPTLALALERLGVVDPAVIARVGTAAYDLSRAGSSNRIGPILSRWQAALALLEQSSRLRRLPASRNAALVLALGEAATRPVPDVSAAIAAWVTDALMPALAPDRPAAKVDRAWLTRALAGDVDQNTQRVMWEGLGYERNPVRVAMRDFDRLVLASGSAKEDSSGADLPGRPDRDQRTPEDVLVQSSVYALAMTPLHQPAALQAEAWSFHRLVPDSERGSEWWRAAWRLAIPDVRSGGGSALTGSWLTIDLALAEATVPRRFDQGSALAMTVRDAIFRDLAVRVHAPGSRAPEMDVMRRQLARGRSMLADWRRSAPVPGQELRRQFVAARLGSTRANLALWTSMRNPENLALALTTAEIARLGGAVERSVPSEAIDGCVCLIPLPPQPIDDLRASWRVGVTASLANDAALRVGEALEVLGLPMDLVDDVLPLLTADWLAHIEPYANDDWEALALWPKRLTQGEVEGYVLQLVAEGILTPVEEVVP